MKRLILILLAFLPLVMPSCSEADGAWPPMKWRMYDGKDELKSLTFEVSADGETYDFYCKNYSGYWIEAINEDGTVTSTSVLAELSSASSFSTQYVSINIDGHEMHLTIKPNSATDSRNIGITVTAGDVFSSFTFTQEGK